jgi:ABC-type branched-subunit amino acid transport system ATPase component
MSTRYTVTFAAFSERHFEKKFQKKYKRAWDITREALVREFQNIEVLFDKSIAEVIAFNDTVKICKTEFTVAQTNQSRKASGNRCIVAIHTDTLQVSVLLVYHKNDLGGGNETANWKRLIKENYTEYRDLL